MKGVWWIKRDFRLSDNECLSMGTEQCSELLPFFCWEPEIINHSDYSVFHLQAQWQGLSGICQSLRKRNSGLCEEYGEIIEVLDGIFHKFNFEVLYSHQETGNLVSFARDRKVANWCTQKGVKWIEVNASSVLRGGNADLRRVKLRQKDYRLQNPLPIPLDFSKPKQNNIFNRVCSWKELVSRFSKFTRSGFPSATQKVNESNAWKTVESFLEDRALGYSGGISSPNLAFTHGSRLSPHLAWGTISLRSVFHALDKRISEIKKSETPTGWSRSLRAFQSRLYWRDHFIQRLEAFPELEVRTLNPAFDEIEYEESDELLEAWVKGETGFPMVDACMRCLTETGFLNFRMRAMVVSFACFGLHLSWRKIHQPLANLFLDYEPGIHLSQLQMQAGVIGFNTLRVYSPTKQFIDQDPNGYFVKNWVPELAGQTVTEIAKSEKMKIKGYASPIVSLSDRSRQMKDRIYSIRKSTGGKKATQKTLKDHGSKKTPSRKKRKKEDGQLLLFKS